jgi:hypothetical protein
MSLYKQNRLFTQKTREASIEVKYEGFNDKLRINININILDKNTTIPFLVTAMYKTLYNNNSNIQSTNRNIDVSIKIAPNFSYKSFNNFYMETVAVIRHELEHMVQDQKKWMSKYNIGYNIEKLNEPNPIKKFMEIANYLSSIFEKDAFIRGLVLLCKKEKLQAIKIIKEFIHDSLFSENPAIENAIKKEYGLQAEHIEKILVDLYMKKMKEIFPNIKDVS